MPPDDSNSAITVSTLPADEASPPSLAPSDPFEAVESAAATRNVDPRRTTWQRRTIGLAFLSGSLLLAVVGSLTIGAKSIPLASVVDALLSHDPTNTDHIIVRELRVPRTMLGLMVGAALGVAGALMQAVTRNPLGDPGILGVNAGAAFAVVLALWAFGISSAIGVVWFAFAGAAITSVVVYLLGSAGRGGATPVRLALAGAALSAFLFALTRAVTLIDQSTLNQFRFWIVGSLAGRDEQVAYQLAPFVIVGMTVAMIVRGPLNALGLGDDAAASLGIKVNRTRAITGFAIMLLCGAAVAACGPIAFVGLVVPHVVRAWFGPDQRWLLPACAIAGPAFLIACDTLGRIVAWPGEVQVGIMTAAIGGPAFVFIVRRMRMVQL